MKKDIIIGTVLGTILGSGLTYLAISPQTFPPSTRTGISIKAEADELILYRKSLYKFTEEPWRCFPEKDDPSLNLEKGTYDFRKIKGQTEQIITEVECTSPKRCINSFD